VTTPTGAAGLQAGEGAASRAQHAVCGYLPEGTLNDKVADLSSHSNGRTSSGLRGASCCKLRPYQHAPCYLGH
jgi:hypothetical protein